jgi:hypothetical protein
MTKSTAGAGEGVDQPDDVKSTMVDINGYSGIVLRWDGETYDRKKCWMMCHDDNLCNLGGWQ